MRLSQLFVLSARGDALAFHDFRQDVPRDSDKVFFREYKFGGGRARQAPQEDCPPFFVKDGVYFCYVRRRQLLFVSTSRVNESPSATVELLDRTVAILRDYLGVLSEESVRRNFTLVYELWHEMLLFGVPQEMRTEALRPRIFHDVKEVASPEHGGGSLLDRLGQPSFSDRTKRSDAASVSVVQRSEGANDVFVDVLERLAVTFDGAGNVTLAEVDGAVTLKSFLVGSPMLSLGLDKGIEIGEQVNPMRSRYASAVVDAVCFHEEVDTSRFEQERLIRVRPSTGETTLLRYRSTAADRIRIPFRLVQSLQLLTSERAELTVRVQSDFPGEVSAIGTRVTVPLPLTTTHAAMEAGVGGSANETAEFLEAEKALQWGIPQFSGGTERVGKISFSTSAPITDAVRREIGPITMYFEIPLHSATGVQIKSLWVEERSNTYSSTRWIRSMTQANSYVFRTH